MPRLLAFIYILSYLDSKDIFVPTIGYRFYFSALQAGHFCPALDARSNAVNLENRYNP